MKQNKLKIGLIIDSDSGVSKYVYELFEWANQQASLEVTHLIIQKIPNKVTGGNRFVKAAKKLREKGLQAFTGGIAWRTLIHLEKIKLKRSGIHADHLSQKTISGATNEIHVAPMVSQSGYVFRYPDDDLEKIRSANIDVLIRCGSGILRGKILNACRFGILSFHHGDNRINRGGPAGFWEVFQKEPQTGFIIQKLTDELNGGEIFFRGAFPTENFFLLNQANLYSRSNFYMKQVLLNLAETGSLPQAEPGLPYSYPLLKSPKLSVQLKYLADKLAFLAESKVVKMTSRRADRWAVAFQRKDWQQLVMWKAHKIQNPPGRFLADPFVITRDQADYCFVEDYDYSTRRGCISVAKLGKSGAEYIEKIITEPFHMSFPYLLEHEGSLLMIPETSENKDIRVYECIEFPLKWRLKSILMAGISAADTMIFFKDGLWWMLTNINPNNGEDHCSELFVFYATDPLSSEWNPHPMNPIYVDPSKARNGGLLRNGDQIYRVAQKQGFRQYGAESKIFRIDLIDKQNYQETLITEIKPYFFNAKGTHHLHSNGKITVFDYLVNEKIN
jgi:hypothetical protein